MITQTFSHWCVFLCQTFSCTWDVTGVESFAQGLCTMVEVLHEDSILYCPSSSPEITSYLFPPIILIAINWKEMGKLKLSVQRKNERRRKYGVYPVRILRDNVDIMRVSIPLQALSYKLSLPLLLPILLTNHSTLFAHHHHHSTIHSYWAYALFPSPVVSCMTYPLRQRSWMSYCWWSLTLPCPL